MQIPLRVWMQKSIFDSSKGLFGELFGVVGYNSVHEAAFETFPILLRATGGGVLFK